jgi:hypothetical protein
LHGLQLGVLTYKVRQGIQRSSRFCVRSIH